MKTWIKILITGVTTFVAGFAAGYFVHKKVSEVEIEEITEEELDELTSQVKEETGSTSNDIPDNITSDAVNQSKEDYFKRWKTEVPTNDIYDTRSKETPEDAVTNGDVEQIEDYLSNLEQIEAGTMADWMRHTSTPDGEYDPIEITWYEKDGVICDDHDDPLLNSEKYMGFDIQEEFQLVDPETTGDPDVRVIFNHKTKTIYHITRVNRTSYGRKKRLEEYGLDGYDEDEEEDTDE